LVEFPVHVAVKFLCQRTRCSWHTNNQARDLDHQKL